MNDNVGLGEQAELLLLKNHKQVDGNFLLYHGVTNILRFGDYTLVNLTTLKIVGIAELKSKYAGYKKLDLNLSVILRSNKNNAEKHDTAKNRLERQLLGINKFLNYSGSFPRMPVENLQTTFNFQKIDKILANTSCRESKIEKIDDGLVVASVKFRKSSLLYSIYHRNKITDKNFSNRLAEIILDTMQKDSNNNSIVYGQLLYNLKFTPYTSPGNIPIFWYPLDIKALKNLYFAQGFVLTFFNPAKLIDRIERLGFHIKSKYIQVDNSFYKNRTDEDKPIKVLENFDFFVRQIVSDLYSEDYVIETLIKADRHLKEDRKIHIKPYLFPSDFHINRNKFKH